MMTDLPCSPASERNKQPILESLQGIFERHHVRAGTVLEIGAGTGQHAVHFAPHFPNLKWLPTDRRDALPGLCARLAAEGSENVLPALALDVLEPWPLPNSESTGGEPVVAAFSANTAHIMSWKGVCAMIDGLAGILPPSGIFCLYGPFRVGGHFTAPSNDAFDRQLRSHDPEMGVRDINDIESHAARHQMSLVEDHSLPANNQLLVWRRG